MASPTPSSMTCAQILRDPCLGSFDVQGDADIAGIGVLLSFLLSAGFMIILAVGAYNFGMVPKEMLTEYDLHFIRFRSRFSQRWRNAFETAVLSFSDLQLVTGIAILIAGFAKLGGMPNFTSGSDQGISVYHWQVVVHLAWLSSNVHLTTITFLRSRLQSSATMRTLRITLMLILACLLLAALVPTLTFAWTESLSPSVNPMPSSVGNGICGNSYALQIPARCFWNLSEVMESGPFLSDDHSQSWKTFIRQLLLINPDAVFALIFLIISYTWKITALSKSSNQDLNQSLHLLTTEPWKCLIIKLHACRREHSRAFVLLLPACQWFATGTYLLLVALLFLFESFAGSLWIQSIAFVWATVQLIQPRNLLPSPALQIESLWNFGQILPLLLLVLPIVSIAESISRSKEPSKDEHVGEEKPCPYRKSLDTGYPSIQCTTSVLEMQEAWIKSGKCPQSLEGIRKALLGVQITDACTKQQHRPQSHHRILFGSKTFCIILVLLNVLFLYGGIIVLVHGLQISDLVWCGSPLFPGVAICLIWIFTLLSALWSSAYKIQVEDYKF